MRDDSQSIADDTGDIAALRAFAPSTTMLEPALDAQFRGAERQIADQYSNYSGIPSAVARNRMQSLATNELAASKMFALAQGNKDANAARQGQLTALADLTKTTRSTGKGFGTQQAQQSQGNGLLAGGVSAGGAIAAAAIVA